MPNLLPVALLMAIWCGSLALAGVPVILALQAGVFPALAALFVAPILFTLAFPTIAGLLSRPAQKGIKRGKFPRQPLHPVYLLRRIYGLAWTQVFYFRPLYAIILAVPVLKKYVFRLFGYKGSTKFVLYPDTWVRDLPILEVGEGAYLSNRATIGTNMCLTDGTIFVSPIKIKAKGLIGHLAMLAPGVTIGEGAEVGVGCAIGVGVRMGNGASVRPSCTLNHGSIIGAKAEIGTMSYIGLRAEIGEGIAIPAGANIPGGAILKTQADVERYYSSETAMLHAHKDAVLSALQQNVDHE